MPDNTYYFLYAPETRIKKHVRVPIPNPRLVLDLFKQGNGKRECRQNTVWILFTQKLNFQADAMPMIHKGQVCEMPTDEA